MFGFGRDRKDAIAVGTAAARMAVMPFYDMFARQLDARIWSDRYVLGIIQGMAMAQTMPITGRKLSTTDKGYVIIGVMKNLGASDRVREWALELVTHKDTQFLRGMDDAFITTALMAGLMSPEEMDSPDIADALSNIPFYRKFDGVFGEGAADEQQEQATAYIYSRVSAHKRSLYEDGS